MEQEADQILEGAESEAVSFLVVGDPFGLVGGPQPPILELELKDALDCRSILGQQPTRILWFAQRNVESPSSPFTTLRS